MEYFSEIGKILEDLFKRADSRGKLFLKTAEVSRDEVAKAIYRMSAELCELEKLLIMLLLRLDAIIAKMGS